MAEVAVAEFPYVSFPDQESWSVQVLRLVAEGTYGGADLHEVYRAVTRLRGEDRTAEVWTRVWEELAREAEDQARQAAAAGHARTACEAYFRAANYYRMAEFYLPPDHPDKMRLYLRCREAFRSALPHADPPVEPVRVPYGDHHLEGYFFHPHRPARGAAVAYFGGADSLAEELLFLGGRALLDRGMYLCVVDTPGRGSALRLMGLTARPDYEEAGRPVLDYLAGRPEVDPRRIGILGISMGGYYAPRVAAFDRRARALACWSACYSVLEDIYDFYPPIRRQLHWVVGARTPEEARERLAAFTLEEAAPHIACPTLILHGAEDPIIRPEAARRVWERLTCPKELHIWTRQEGGSAHCNYDRFAAAASLIADWLYDRLCRD